MYAPVRKHELTIGWFIFTLIMTVGTVRTSFAFFGLFVSLSATFFILAIGCYNDQNADCMKVGGYFGLITALFGWYNGCALMWNRDNSWITLPVGQFRWAKA